MAAIEGPVEAAATAVVDDVDDGLGSLASSAVDDAFVMGLAAAKAASNPTAADLKNPW